MRRGEDTEAGAVDLVQFLRTRMNMDEPRAVARNVEQRVAARRDLAQPRPDGEHKIAHFGVVARGITGPQNLALGLDRTVVAGVAAGQQRRGGRCGHQG